MITSFSFQPTALIALAIAIAIAIAIALAIGIGIAIAIADSIAIGIAIGMSSPDDRCTLLSGYYAMPYGIEVLYEVKGPKNCPRDVLDIIRYKCQGPIFWWLIFWLPSRRNADRCLQHKSGKAMEGVSIQDGQKRSVW